MSLLLSRDMDGVVLVLNQNYEPLNVCNLPRAFRLVFGERAEVIEYDHQVIRTPRTEYRAPSVIRLVHFVRVPFRSRVPPAQAGPHARTQAAGPNRRLQPPTCNRSSALNKGTKASRSCDHAAGGGFAR